MLSYLPNLLGALCLGLSTAVAAQKEATAARLVLGSDQFCPYVCAGGSQPAGYLVDFARAVLEPAGFHVVIDLQPWSRAMRNVATGQMDGLLAVSESRSQGLVRSPALGVDSVGFMSAKPLQPITAANLYQLNGLRIAQVDPKLTDPNTPFDRYIHSRMSRDDGTIVSVSSDNPAAQMVKMLLAGRVDLVIDNPVVLAFTAKQLEAPELLLSGHFNAKPLYIAFRDNTTGERAAALLAAALPRWRADGRWAALLARYGLTETWPLPDDS